MVSKFERKAELRNFLKTCRARLRPEDVGLSPVGRRRVPGLRRDEVAELCGISLAWYTLLETAHDIRVSPRLLHRLSCALRLTDVEKLRLFSLAIDELPIQHANGKSGDVCPRCHLELAGNVL